jgi:hypothetical protein
VERFDRFSLKEQDRSGHRMKDPSQPQQHRERVQTTTPA